MDDVFDDVLRLQEAFYKDGKDEGFSAGLLDQDAFDLGVVKGRELGREVGFVSGFCAAIRKHICENDPRWSKIASPVDQMEKSVSAINWKDPASETLSTLMDLMRAKLRNLLVNFSFFGCDFLFGGPGTSKFVVCSGSRFRAFLRRTCFEACSVYFIEAAPALAFALACIWSRNTINSS